MLCPRHATESYATGVADSVAPVDFAPGGSIAVQKLKALIGRWQMAVSCLIWEALAQSTAIPTCCGIASRADRLLYASCCNSNATTVL